MRGTNLKEILLEKLNTKSRAEILELYKQTEELKIRETENAGTRYVPNTKSEEFIKMVGSNKVFVNMFIAANGVGKSCTGANIIANICFGPLNDYFKDLELFEKFPYLKRGRIVADPTTIKSKIVPELKKWFPSNRYQEKWESTKDGKGFESKWITDTGFEFDIMSNEQDPKEFESADLGFIWLDEPVKMSIYKACVARTRTGGIILWTFTPLNYSAAIKDQVYDKRDGTNIDYIEADVWANCKDIPGTRGILSKDNIDRMISQYSEDEKEARINGKFGHLLGRVHKAFNRRIHVIKPFKVDKNKFVVVKAHDTHPREPDHILWMAISEKGTKFIVNELIMRGTVVEMASEIQRIEKDNGYRMLGDDLIDPSAFNADERRGEMSVADMLYEAGVVYRRGSKDLTGCILRTDEALKYEERLGELVVAPEVYICENCQTTIKQLEEYVWDEYAGKAADSKQDKGRPKDKNDHNVENLHRLLKEDYKYKEAKPIKTEDYFQKVMKKRKKSRTVNTRRTAY